ncbi:Aromatic amino acid lyase, partial [Anaerobranca californiensis DSM 14826]
MEKVLLDGTSLTVEEIHKVVFENVSVALSPKGREQVLNSRKFVEEIIAEGKIVYGITTGFGKFSDVFISRENTAQLQLNLIISHACGVGEP